MYMSLQKKLKNIVLFFPVQLFILHLRKFQTLLFFWLVLILIINGSLLSRFGSDSLFLTPEYLGTVNMAGGFITGIACGIFVMSWNITTFILHSKRMRFLATSAQPFLRYCINNFLFPLFFLILYFIKMYNFNEYRELLAPLDILLLMTGFLAGFILLSAISFAYFFTAEKKIVRDIAPIVADPETFRKAFMNHQPVSDAFGLKVSYYISTHFRIKQVRHVEHYPRQFIEMIFKRHHIASIVSIGLSFIFLVGIGFLLDYPIFEIPAAASVFIFFAILIAFMGAINHFLKTWSLPVFILVLSLLNYMVAQKIIDPRNKAYGIDYSNNMVTPRYDKDGLSKLCTPQKINDDKIRMLEVLQNWKKKQTESKPIIVFVNVSGGGLRSAAFVMNALQQMDSATGGKLMSHAFMITGASGGMLAASYFREIYRHHLVHQDIPLYSQTYTDNMSKDLLNPVFSSMIARDIFAPVQKFHRGDFEYIKDRGYAFEKTLSRNTGGLLNTTIQEMTADEFAGKVPILLISPTIKTDGRKLLISSLPMSFMMKPKSFDYDSAYSPDAVDFNAFFSARKSRDIRLITALRMNATFPYVLPNVWLPSDPVIDVMDAGLRDNFGQETTLRFIDNFQEWLRQNTGGVMIVKIRDHAHDSWDVDNKDGSLTDLLTGPATMLQQSWYKIQDYYQADTYHYLNSMQDGFVKKYSIVYRPENEEAGARLSFHLTTREKLDIVKSLGNVDNAAALKEIQKVLAP